MYEGAVQDLIDELGRLPGIGPKSAQRIAFHLLAADPADVERLALHADAGQGRGPVLPDLRQRRRGATSAGSAVTRAATPSVICVVEEPKDVVAVERTAGVPRALPRARRGHQPDRRRRARTTCGMRELHAAGCADGTVTELILATDPNLEGEATATYLARLVKPMRLTVTRLASGLPVGGDLEYADEVTLGRAFSGRRRVE